MRDQVDAGHLLAELVEREGHRRDDQICFVGGNGSLPHANNIHRGARLLPNTHLEFVVKAQREAERVKARPEVCRGGRNPNRDAATREIHYVSPPATRPSTSAMALTSTGTDVGVTSEPSARRRAHCGSFNP